MEEVAKEEVGGGGSREEGLLFRAIGVVIGPDVFVHHSSEEDGDRDGESLKPVANCHCNKGTVKVDRGAGV